MNKNLELFRYNPVKKQITLNIKVKAGAKENSVSEFVTVNDLLHLKVSIKAIAEGGRANLMIMSYLSKLWIIPKQDIKIIQGLTSSYKVIAIENIEKEYLEKLLTKKLPVTKI